MADDSATLVKESRAIEEVLERMVGHSDQQAKSSMESAENIYTASRFMMLTLVLAGIVASVGLGVVMARLLQRQIGGEPGYAAESSTAWQLAT